MRFLTSTLCLLLLGALCLSSAAQPGVSPDEMRIEVPDTNTVVKVRADGAAFVSRNGGRDFVALQPVQTTLQFHYATFDPVVDGEPPVPVALKAPARSRLYIVQFHTQILEEYRRGLLALGAEIHHYLAHQAYLVRMDPETASLVRALPHVRWVGRYHPAYKLEGALLEALLAKGGLPPTRLNVVMVDYRRDEADLLAAVRRAGGQVVNPAFGSILIEALLDGNQLVEVAAADTVLWIDRWTQPGEDIDNARIQGGANYLEPKKPLRYTGKGVVGMIMEGIYATHPEFGATAYRTTPRAIGNGNPSGHGNATCGEIFAKGVSPSYRGLCPDGQPLYCNYIYVYNNNRRYSVTQTAINQYQCMFQTASWGYARTTQYTSRSAEMDRIIFDLDIPITQSQSNAGATSNPRMSRPQAWAKNIIGVGGTYHYDNANPADDKWNRSGSTGPAADGRVQPTMCAYYDRIRTTGYSSTSYTTSFGGTSGATPIVAGHVGLIVEMFTTPVNGAGTEGLFGNPLAPGSNWKTRFKNRPHFTTTKALLVNGAVPYPNTGRYSRHDRWTQGWGFPSVQTLYDARNRLIAVDEYDVLKNLQSVSYFVWAPGGSDLRVTMTYNEPETAPVTKMPHRINDLSLMVRAPAGTVYWGNYGLRTTLSSNWSTPGGGPDTIDPLENVFIKAAPRGIYEVKVIASQVNQDNHKETPAVDADFALVINGIRNRDRTGSRLDLFSTSTGDFRVQLTNLPLTGWTEGHVVYSLTVTRPKGYGRAFGIEPDVVTLATLAQPAIVGSPFHFRKTSLPVFPNRPYAFSSAIAAALKGMTVDAVAFLVTSTGQILDFSNAARVTVK